MQDVFISYSTKNKQTAQKVCEKLEANGLECWIAPRNIQAGKEWGEQIIRGIENSRVLVLIFSSASNASPQVLREVERAINKRRRIVIFRIENVGPSDSMEYFLATNHWINAFNGDLEEHIEGLAQTIKTLISETPLPETQHCEKKLSHQGSGLANYFYRKPMRLVGGIAIIIVLLVIAYNLNAIRKQLIANQTQLTTTGNMVQTMSPQDQQESTMEKNGQPISEQAKTSETTKKEVNKLTTKEVTKEANKEAKAEVNGNIKEEEKGLSKEKVQATASIQENQQINALESSQKADFKIGSTIIFGVYQNAPIEWLVIHKDASGNPLLLAKNIISTKSYSAAQSGTYNHANTGAVFDGKKEKEAPGQNYTADEMRQMKGSNDWANSCIRAWLNSGNKTVNYNGQAPTNEAVSVSNSGYSKAYGFLYEFTSNERSLILPITHASILSQLDQGRKKGGSELFKYEKIDIVDCLLNSDQAFYENVTDKVFLLSIDEVEKFLLTHSIPIKTELTPEAIQNDKSGWYNDLKGQTGGYHMWWLRTPVGDHGSQVCTVATSGEQIYAEYATSAGVGVRPALYVDASKCTLKNDTIQKMQ